MTSGKTLATVLGIAGLLLGLGASANAASMRARQPTTPLAGFRSLPQPPPIVGYPPQIYMNMLPPAAVGPSFGSNFGFSRPERRHDFHRFDGAFQNDHDR